ncbi:MAG: hypothetical protein Q8941_03735 [Bacteroidota bacterium]|nr:hypothetical protein [Bacteroidota bacterium]
MEEDFSPLNEKEQLQTENDFIKMKLMLEKGAEFGSAGSEELSPELENIFLKNVMAFEEQFEQHKTIKVFDKIGRPGHFKPVNEIPDNDMGKAWDELRDYLNKYGLDLGVCSPYISTRELYRFTIEELFDHETDDMLLPGWTTNFIYDEFHPDPVYESEKAVKEDLFPALFKTAPVDEYFYCLHDQNILLNGKCYRERKDINAAFNRFKSLFSEMDLQKVIIDRCDVKSDSKTVVSGNYKVIATSITDKKEESFEGKFTIELRPDDLGYWSIKNMEIEAVNF